MECTIYARFSNHEQAHGDSQERQLRLCREMALRNHWKVVQEVIDEGRSAFTGVNRMEGSMLWEFEQRARSGALKGGHVLVVENLDRISRQGYDVVLPFLRDMTMNGITVATVDGGRIYRANERVELGPVIEAVVKAELAREESEKKSQRLREAQKRKVEQAQAYADKGEFIATTKIVPAWIDVDDATYAMSLNEERVRVLREIFQLTIDGYGTPAIAKMLNARGEPVWNNRGRKSNHGWTVGYLTKIVVSRAVMGEFLPMNRPRHGKATSKGVVIPNRFPQAIDPKTFARAQAARQSRRNSSGAWQISHGNLFSGIAKCQSCGGRMKQEVTVRKGQMRRKGPLHNAYPAGGDISYLKCHNALNRVTDEKSGVRRCVNTAWVRYEPVERKVLELALHFAAVRTNHAHRETTDTELALLNADHQIEEVQRQVDNLVDSFSRTGSVSVEKAMLHRELELGQLQARRTELLAAFESTLAASPPSDHMAQVASLRTELEAEDVTVRNNARIRMKQVLRNLVNRMECGPSKETLVVLGNEAVGILIDSTGEIAGNWLLQQRIFGPNGESDWHPDQEHNKAA